MTISKVFVQDRIYDQAYVSGISRTAQRGTGVIENSVYLFKVSDEELSSDETISLYIGRQSPTHLFVVRADLPRSSNGLFRYSRVISRLLIDLTRCTTFSMLPSMIVGVYHPKGIESAREYYVENALDIDSFVSQIDDRIVVYE